MSVSSVSSGNFYSELPSEGRGPEGGNVKVSQCADSIIKRETAGKSIGLRGRVVLGVKAVFKWIKKIILMILGWFKKKQHTSSSKEGAADTGKKSGQFPPQPLPLVLTKAGAQHPLTTFKLTRTENAPARLLNGGITDLLNIPEFKFTFGTTAISVANPFSSSTKPSDDQVWQFKSNVQKMLWAANGASPITIDLGQASFLLQVPANAYLNSDLLSERLLILPKLLQAGTKGGLQLSIPDASHLPLLNGTSSEKGQLLLHTKADLSLMQEKAVSLLELAKKKYEDQTEPPPSKSGQDEPLFPLLESSNPDLESGRNLLLNYVEELTTVWDQDPLRLGLAVMYCVKLSESEVEVSKEQKEKIRLFFNKLKARFSPDDFALYLAHRINLQRILSTRLDDLLKIGNPNAAQQMEIDLAKAELATSFGYGIIPTQGGKNGAVFIKTFEDRKVGVFKAPKELGMFDLVERLKLYVGQARLLSNEPLAQEYAEVVASDLCREFGMSGMAPAAIMAEFAGVRGAFISFLSGYDELASVHRTFKERKEFSNAEILMWQKMVLWNFLIGNLDPHDANIFIKLTVTGEIEDIRMIDHGNAFPQHNPGFFGSKGNLGAWGRFSISSSEFLPEVREWIKSNLIEAKFTAFFDADHERSSFFKPEMRKLQLERVRLLIECVAEGKIKTPKALAKVKTDHHFKSYLKGARPGAENN